MYKTFSIWMTLLLFIGVIVYCKTRCCIGSFLPTLTVIDWTWNSFQSRKNLIRTIEGNWAILGNCQTTITHVFALDIYTTHTRRIIFPSVSHDNISDVLLKSHSQVRPLLLLSAFLNIYPGKHLATVTLINVTGNWQYEFNLIMKNCSNIIAMYDVCNSPLKHPNLLLDKLQWWSFSKQGFLKGSCMLFPIQIALVHNN